jgi:hypothetical protein
MGGLLHATLPLLLGSIGGVRSSLLLRVGVESMERGKFREQNHVSLDCMVKNQPSHRARCTKTLSFYLFFSFPRTS